MKILAICGSYRKQGVISVLMDKAIEGIREASPGASVEKVCLIEKKIEYCRGCMACFPDDPAKRIAACVIKDDMFALFLRRRHEVLPRDSALRAERENRRLALCRQGPAGRGRDPSGAFLPRGAGAGREAGAGRSAVREEALRAEYPGRRGLRRLF
ncbi:MAG: flavodoxin family protein [Lentisphaerae bacterium]|nr:flavodoxin family protein [Lentisphaerota bacterium]